MALPIVIVIEDDPLTSHRPVEALRIAAGLSTGAPVQVALLNGAPRLLSDDNEDVVDLDILEKHLPAIPDLDIEFLVEPGAAVQYHIPDDFRIRETPLPTLASLVASAPRVLVF